MSDKEQVKSRIRKAFMHVEYPGDWCLRGSNEGEEPFLLEKEFKGKNNWQILDSKFLDEAPDGFASALSFFSEEAFHFYLPAYLMADIDGHLERSDPVFHLIRGLTNGTKNERVNPRRYGDRTWFDQARYQFSIFNKEESSAIVAYLEHKRTSASDHEKREIDEALRNYWLEKSGTQNSNQ